MGRQDSARSSGLSYSSRSTESIASAQGGDHVETLSPPAESSDDLVKTWAKHIFRHRFETGFGLMLGRYGCPFINDPESETNIPLSTLVQLLDANMHKDVERRILGSTTATGSVVSMTNDLVDHCLSSAILAFTARWGPPNLQSGGGKDIVASSWRSARSNMLLLLNRASYRTVLALYLFAQTPVPVEISEDEELSSINGPVCMQTALMHIQKLRQRRDLARKAKPFEPEIPVNVTQAFIDLESRAYWAAVMWDTANSLATDMRTSLTSGLNGACAEPAWRLVRAFLITSFVPATKDWVVEGLQVSDETASRIIGAASICQVYIWKTITSLKEAVREGVEEDSLLWVWGALLESISIFRTSIQPLLDSCAKRIHFLGHTVRFGWYEVSLRYCMGILVLLDALDTAKRFDLLQQLVKVRDEAENEAFNVLKFGIESTFNLARFPESRDALTEPGITSRISTEQTRTTLVNGYAFSDHIVTIAQLLLKVIMRKRHEGNLNSSVFAHLSSILFVSLDQLPKASKTIQSAIQYLRTSINEANG